MPPEERVVEAVGLERPAEAARARADDEEPAQPIVHRARHHDAAAPSDAAVVQRASVHDRRRQHDGIARRGADAFHERLLGRNIVAREIDRLARVAVDGLQGDVRRVRLEGGEIERQRAARANPRVPVQRCADAVGIHERRHPPAKREIVEADGERGLVATRVTRNVVDRIRRPRRQSVHVVEEQPLLQHDADRASRIRVAHPAALEHKRHVVHRAFQHAQPPSMPMRTCIFAHDTRRSERTTRTSATVIGHSEIRQSCVEKP